MIWLKSEFSNSRPSVRSRGLLSKTSEFSNSRHPEADRPSQIVRILKFQTRPSAPEADRPRLHSRPLSATPFSSVDNLVPDRELAQVHRQIFQENQPDFSCQICFSANAQSEQKVKSEVCLTVKTAIELIRLQVAPSCGGSKNQLGGEKEAPFRLCTTPLAKKRLPDTCCDMCWL